MAKKTHVKVRLVPESKPNSAFFYYVKKPASGEKSKGAEEDDGLFDDDDAEDWNVEDEDWAE